MINLLHKKYSDETIKMLGLTSDNIKYILNSKTHLLKTEIGISKIFNIIDSVVQRKLNGPNTPLTDLNISSYKNDIKTKIPYDNYVKDNKGSYINIVEEDNDINNDISNIVGDMGNVLNISQPENNKLNNNDNSIKNIFLDANNEIYLVIDSKDRNINKYKYANDYIIDLRNKNLNNIYAIELAEVILLNTEEKPMSSDNLNKPPYLLLELTNLSNDTNNLITINNNDINEDNNEKDEDSYLGSYKKYNNAFTILSHYEKINNYKYYKKLNVTKKYKNPINIDEIGVRFRLPSGKLFNFGDEANDSIYTVSLLIFKIYKKN